MPVLILMINSFIHLGVSPHYFNQWRLAAQFYQVFAHFSEIGELARLYLLKCRTMGRFLDMFFSGYGGDKSKVEVTENYRCNSLTHIPLFILEKELYMNTNLEKNEFKMSVLEKKALLADSSSPFMFLWYTVAVLSRSCEFTKDTELNQFANDNLRFKLEEDEIGMLINHKSPLVWEECKVKLVRNAIAEMFAHISFENKEFSLQFIQTLIEGLQNSTFDQMKTYERPLLKMLLIKDQYQLDRAKKILTGLLDVMKSNSLYYKDVDQIIEIVYKILQKSAIAVEYLSKNPLLMRFIEQWCKENLHFPLNQQKMKVFKQGVIVWNQLKQNLTINQQSKSYLNLICAVSH